MHYTVHYIRIYSAMHYTVHYIRIYSEMYYKALECTV